MRWLGGCLAMMGLALLSGCTPADEQYCQSFGVGGTSEFGKCMEYYHQQEAAFAADSDVCAVEADMTYPPTLYDYGHYEQVMGGWNGLYYGGQTVRVEPDFRHNAEVDRLRMRIIGPCMQAKGWNSATSWQAGRHAVSPVKRPAIPPAKPLPWMGSAPLETPVPPSAPLPWVK